MTPIEAAEAAIACLERGAPIGTDLLIVMARATGDNAELLRRRRTSGYAPMTRQQTLLAIWELRALITVWRRRRR